MGEVFPFSYEKKVQLFISEIPVDDVERRKEFYSNIFGWEFKNSICLPMDPQKVIHIMLSTPRKLMKSTWLKLLEPLTGNDEKKKSRATFPQLYCCRLSRYKTGRNSKRGGTICMPKPKSPQEWVGLLVLKTPRET